MNVYSSVQIVCEQILILPILNTSLGSNDTISVAFQSLEISL